MDSPEPLISVVIPTYNYAEVLPRAILSVLAQLDGTSAELIVIDDGSTDDTPRVIEHLNQEHPGCFRSVVKKNGGASSARNRGIAEAKGQYLIFLDADDELAPGALSAIREHLQEHPWTRMIVGGHYAVWSDGRRRELIPGKLPDEPMARVRGYLLDKRLSLSNGACVMHREVFARGNYPEQFRSAEDIPVFTQVLANYPCSVLARPLALIHKHDDSLRHQFVHAKSVGVSLVDEVFSPRRLEGEFLALKPQYFVQRCLSLFRSAYLANDKCSAREYFLTAFRQDWRVLLKWPYVSKALRLWFR